MGLLVALVMMVEVIVYSVGSSDGDDCSPQFMVLVVCAVSDPGLRSSSHRDVEMQI